MFTTALHPLAERPALHVARGPNNGPPLLMMHGVLRGWRDFAPLFGALLPRQTLLSLDHRGHGSSERGAYYAVRDYAGDALALIDSDIVTQPAILYGHSLGALVAAHVAAMRPDRVRAVILEDPPAASFLRSVQASSWHSIWSQMKAAARPVASVREVMQRLAAVRVPTASGEVRLGDVRDATSIRFSAKCLLDLDPAVFDPLLQSRWLDGFDVDSTFAEVRCPALLLRGEEALGGMLPRAEAVRLTELMADADVVDVPGAGHLIHWQATEATARLVLGFVESL